MGEKLFDMAGKSGNRKIQPPLKTYSGKENCKPAPQNPPAPLLSVNILHKTFGTNRQKRRMLHIPPDQLEGRGVIKPVADALIGHNLEINVLARLGGAVPPDLHHAALDAVGDEHGQGAEIVI